MARLLSTREVYAGCFPLEGTEGICAGYFTEELVMFRPDCIDKTGGAGVPEDE